jgi:CBS domain containing-hemolysin-like protein
LLAPVIILVHLVNKPFERRKKDNSPSTADEISALAALARSTQQINSQQERIIKAVPQLSEIEVKEVMIPVDNVAFIPHDQSVAAAINFNANDFHTRYPVCERGNYNKIYGYVNFKELVSAFRNKVDEAKLSDFIRPILFVTEDDSLDEVLKKFSSHYCHMAIVHGVNGAVLGMLTLEDIIEELIGDLNDEFDPLPRTFYSPKEGFYVVGGGNPVSILANEAQLDLPKKREPLAIWFEDVYRKKVRVGVVFRYNNAEFYVRKIRRGRVFEFNVKKVM